MLALTGLSFQLWMVDDVYTGKPVPSMGVCLSTSTRQWTDRKSSHAMAKQKCQPSAKTYSLPSKLGSYKKAGR